MSESNQATFQGNDPAAHAPDAAAYDKGKGKAVEDMDVSMDEEEEESEESDAEIVCAQDSLFLSTATNVFFSTLDG
jgi:hypothetical protein